MDDHLREVVKAEMEQFSRSIVGVVENISTTEAPIQKKRRASKSEKILRLIFSWEGIKRWKGFSGVSVDALFAPRGFVEYRDNVSNSIVRKQYSIYDLIEFTVTYRLLSNPKGRQLVIDAVIDILNNRKIKIRGREISLKEYVEKKYGIEWDDFIEEIKSAMNRTMNMYVSLIRNTDGSMIARHIHLRETFKHDDIWIANLSRIITSATINVLRHAKKFSGEELDRAIKTVAPTLEDELGDVAEDVFKDVFPKVKHTNIRAKYDALPRPTINPYIPLLYVDRLAEITQKKKLSRRAERRKESSIL